VQTGLVPALIRLQDEGVRILAVHPLRDLGGVKDVIDIARNRGIKLVIAAGGDGTISAAVNCMVYSDLALGVLPLGTSNDFARSLGVPIDVPDACATIARATARRIDLGLMRTEDGARRYFVHAATVGLNGKFARMATAADWRKRYGRLAYPMAALRALRLREAIEMHITTDHAQIDARVLQANVLNAPIIGGAFQMRVPESTVTDRRLDLLLVGDVKATHLLQALRVVVSRRIRSVPYTHLSHPRYIRIETDRPRDVVVDGECVGTTPVTLESADRALTVIG
jgi:YegS/Rv2252/BmrU family lipid kinase